MDIEELINRIYCSCTAYTSCAMNGDYPSCSACQKMLVEDIVTALHTLQAKYKARDDMVNNLEDEVYRLMKENEKLRKELEDHG